MDPVWVVAERQRARIWQHVHRDHMLELRRGRYSREQCRVSASERRAAGSLTKELLCRVYDENLKKYGRITCYLCGRAFESVQLEHKIPISRGGKTELSNLGLACPGCNRSKGNRTPDEYYKFVVAVS